MRETIQQIGLPTPLAGILTSPPPTTSSAAPVGVLLLNAGVLHRVGAARLNVVLARQLAARGALVLRFDAAGVGESESRGPRSSFHRADVADVIEVMDHLAQSRGVERFVICGLCSGAETAVDVAAADPRVVAVIAMEGYAYPTWGYYLRRYAPRVTDSSVWINLLTGRNPLISGFLGRKRSEDAEASIGGAVTPDGRRFPDRRDVEETHRQLAARGVLQLQVFAGGSHHYYNHESQFRDCFSVVDFGDLLEVHHEPMSDHVFTERNAQARVVTRAVAFLARHGLISAASGGAGALAPSVAGPS